MLLEIKDLTVAYGGAKALDNLNLGIDQGDFVVLLGANGAGKTTTLRAISGLLKPVHGHILFDGKDLLKTQSFRRSELGIAHVPEGRQIFPDHTVAENLQLGGYTARKDLAKSNAALEEIFQLFPRLAERRDQKGGTLSGGVDTPVHVGVRRLLVGGHGCNHLVGWERRGARVEVGDALAVTDLGEERKVLPNRCDVERAHGRHFS